MAWLRIASADRNGVPTTDHGRNGRTRSRAHPFILGAIVPYDSAVVTTLRPVSLRLQSNALTDAGRIRRRNEDAFICDDERGVWLVADGMGGHAAGDVASQEAVRVVHESLSKTRSAREVSYREHRDDGSLWERRLQRLARHASTHVFELAASTGVDAMGTTLSGLFQVGARLISVHVGDSRIYRVRDGHLKQMTADHTLAALKAARARRGERCGEAGPLDEHAITRAIGYLPQVEADVANWSLEATDRYLLCSDGLYRHVSDAELCALLNSGASAAELVKLANQRGGRDNITAVVLDTALSV